MNTKLVELEGKLEFIQTIISTKYKEIMIHVNSIVNEIAEKHNAVVCGSSFRTGLWDEIEIQFSLGFLNDAENRVDFGSDMSFYYSSRTHELSVNYGTIGSWSKSNIYQIKRIALVADVFCNIEYYEEKFKSVSVLADCEYRAWLDDKYECIRMIDSIKEEANKKKLEDLEKSLNVGDTIEFDTDKISHSCMLFAGPATITKICDKTIKVRLSCGLTRMFNKKQILGYISKEVLIVKEK